jgi:cytochrome c peroxidase
MERAATLEDQVRVAVTGERDLGLSMEEAVARVSRDAGYVRTFRTTFGGPVTTERLAQALATFVRSLLAGGSAFDRFLSGDTTALGAVERRGLELFSGRARCARCHAGPLLSDEAFHNTGVWLTRSPQSRRAGLQMAGSLSIQPALRPGETSGSSRSRAAASRFRFWTRRSTNCRGSFSPNGRWIAFMSNESGESEVYVAPFPGPGGRGFDVGPVRVLFGGIAGNRRWDVTPYGQHFLIVENTENEIVPITLVINWVAALRN